MNAEFNWWLLIVGVAAGAGLAWLTLSDWGRREEDVELEERAAEAAWIADVLRERGEAVDPTEAEEILALHRAYLQQAGLFDPADAGSSDSTPEAADNPDWGPDQWAHEAWDEEVSARGSGSSGEANVPRAEEPMTIAMPSTSGAPAVRPSIRSGGSVGPRAAPEARQMGSKPPQP